MNIEHRLHICTVEFLISGRSSDSNFRVAPHGSFGLLNRIGWHNTVEIELRDCPDMRDATVIMYRKMYMCIYSQIVQFTEYHEPMRLN